ncbi:MAG: hypothetical protein RIS76_1245, partial [Verrucomicrobiota bacterium]
MNHRTKSSQFARPILGRIAREAG